MLGMDVADCRRGCSRKWEVPTGTGRLKFQWNWEDRNSSRVAGEFAVADDMNWEELLRGFSMGRIAEGISDGKQESSDGKICSCRRVPMVAEDSSDSGCRRRKIQ